MIGIDIELDIIYGCWIFRGNCENIDSMELSLLLYCKALHIIPKNIPDVQQRDRDIHPTHLGC